MSKTNIRFVDFYDTAKAEMIEDEPIVLVRDMYNVTKLVESREPVATVDNTATRLDIYPDGERYLGVEYTVIA